MVDDVLLNSGTGGDTIAADDIGGIKHQRVKITLGADNTNDGDVASGNPMPIDVLSQIPGTGATNLGKAIDDVAGATDTGVAILAVHEEEALNRVADGAYSNLFLSELGGLWVAPEQHNHLDEMDATTGWSVLGNDTLNLATTTNHLTGTLALTFDKVDGAANTIFAGIQKTITAVNLGELSLHDIVQTACFLPSITDVAYVFIRVGTDASNYNEWRVLVDNLTAGDFQILALAMGNASQTGATGTGIDSTAITYIAAGVAFNAETNTLSGIIFDQIGIFTNHHTATLAAEVGGGVASKIDLQKIGNKNVNRQAGNVGSGTQRVTIATDDVNLAAIKTAIELLDNAVSGAGYNITQQGGVNISLNTGVRDTGTQRVTIATNDLVPISAASLPLPSGASTSAAQLADGHNVTVDNTVGAPANVQLSDGVDVAVISGGGALLVDASATTQPISGTVTASNAAGNVAHDAVDSGNPVKTGGKAKAFDGTPAGVDVAEDDRVDSYHTVDGRQFVEISHPNYFRVSSDFSVAQTNATLKAAPGASLKLYITDIIISNGATAGNITLLDGSGGAVLIELYPAINGGLYHSFRTPLALTANTLLAITSTTVTTHTVTISGFIAA